MKLSITILTLFFSFTMQAQAIKSIAFNLYTDSLKTGVYNYINVDGELQDGRFTPLMADEVNFTATAGKFTGNSLFLDTACTQDSVVVTAVLKAQPGLKKSIVIYLKKLQVDPPLKTEKELLEEWRKQKSRRG